MKKFRFLFSIVLFLIVVALIITVNSTTAQTPTETPTPTPTPTVTTIPTPSPILTPASTPSSISKSTSEIRVIGVYRFGQQEGNTGIGNTAGKRKTDIENAAGIGDIIVIKVSNLQSLVDKAKCLDKNNDKVQNCQEQEIALFLEGRKINGITPISGAPRLEDQTLQFRLQRNTDNGDTWADLLGAPPFFTDKFFKRPTQVSVGLENGYAEPTDIIKDKKFNLVRIRDWLFWPCLFGLLGLVIGMWCLVNKSDIVRDFAPRPSDPKQKPFSLARCQMAFWFFLVIASFVFIWLITGAYDTITPSVLGLISIASGTALGAAAIDVSKPEERESRTSKGWWNDIITDTNDGMSFHRFQIFVWTIVLGAIFLYSVWSRLSMPEFSSTLLALQGISAGTYLGFKIPEKP